MESPYQYEPLGSKTSFRLLELAPRDSGDSLSCRLLVTTTTTCPTYEAISYCWGDDQKLDRMSCGDKVIPITANLNEVLQQLRLPGCSRTLWADAVCINQDDFQERAAQVKFMRTIYHRATKVLICLGSPGNDTYECLNLIRTIYDSLTQSVPALKNKQNAKDVRSLVKRVKSILLDMPSLDSPSWDALALLFDQPWFRRIWVIQEVTEARDAVVIYGGVPIDWIFVRLVAEWIVHSDAAELINKFQTRGIHNASFMSQTKLSLKREDSALELFHQVRDFEASDPRDKVFAMLSHPVDNPGSSRVYNIFLVYLCTLLFWIIYFFFCEIYESRVKDMVEFLIVMSIWSGVWAIPFVAFGFGYVILESIFPVQTLSELLGMEANYNKASQQVFQDIAVAAMSCYQDLKFLSYVLHGARLRDEFPSWSPQWDIGTTRIKLLTSFATQPYKSNSESPPLAATTNKLGRVSSYKDCKSIP